MIFRWSPFKVVQRIPFHAEFWLLALATKGKKNFKNPLVKSTSSLLNLVQDANNVCSVIEKTDKKDKKKEEPGSFFQRQRVDLLLGELAKKFPPKFIAPTQPGPDPKGII